MNEYYRFCLILVAIIAASIFANDAIKKWSEVEHARLHCAPAASGSAP